MFGLYTNNINTIESCFFLSQAIEKRRWILTVIEFRKFKLLVGNGYVGNSILISCQGLSNCTPISRKNSVNFDLRPQFTEFFLSIVVAITTIALEYQLGMITGSALNYNTITLHKCNFEKLGLCRININTTRSCFFSSQAIEKRRWILTLIQFRKIQITYLMGK